jgi:hypothetical protein
MANVKIVHPLFRDQVREVPSTEVKAWTDQGWQREGDLSPKDRKEVQKAQQAPDALPSEGK